MMVQEGPAPLSLSKLSKSDLNLNRSSNKISFNCAMTNGCHVLKSVLLDSKSNERLLYIPASWSLPCLFQSATIYHII